MLILMFALGSCLTLPLFAGGERAHHLIAESAGTQGVAGLGGIAGTAGLPGAPGLPGTPPILDFTDFFALMPGDNSATVGGNVAVEFPQDGPTSGVITRQGGASPSVFVIPVAGTYLVQFQVSVTEPGQLELRINGVADPNTRVGRDTGTSQIVGLSIVTTVGPNTTLEVINPTGNTPALTITPIAGGTQSVSAHLTITRLR